jgi:hypothetical protein
MQTLTHKNVKIVFILLTEQISFIPDNILNRSEVLSFKRPTKTTYFKCIKKNMKDKKLYKIKNIKNLISDIDELDNLNTKIINKIIDNITNYKNIKFLDFRDTIYDIFIYNINLDECLYEIINYYIDKNMINNEKIELIFDKLYKFFRFYNNNYRPIYHLERFLYNLCKIIHEF